jgi:hypothetical protein
MRTMREKWSGPAPKIATADGGADMGLVAVKKNDDGGDPRSSLRRAIADAAKVNDQIERHRQAVARARDMVREAEQKLTVAGEALESARAKHAQAVARAAATGHAAKPNGALRSARAALSDAEDEAAASRAAFDRFVADGEDLEASNPQLENDVLVAVAETVAPAAQKILDQLQQKQAEVATLQQAFLALTDQETVGLPVFYSEAEKLNMRDARAAPLKELRERYFALGSLDSQKSVQERAHEAASAARKWRTALRHDPEAAPEPELPPLPFRG